MIGTSNTNVNIYRVVGRYMSGSTVSGYHLVGPTGNQLHVTKERLIYMIGKGFIENMRVQSSGEELILRGKGINLNKLPVYDEKHSKFRDNEASKSAEGTKVIPKRNSGINPMGQLKIIKRIMYKTNCLGYMVRDFSGKEMKLSRKKVIALATEKLISNAIVQKYNAPGETEPRIILRGVGYNLSELPAVIVDKNGNIIDINKDPSLIKLRAVKMKRGGIVYDKEKNKKMPFEPGDYLVCGLKGVIRPVKNNEVVLKFKIAKEDNVALCDDYLENLANYPIEIFGALARELKPEQVIKWVIIKPIDTMEREKSII